MQGGSVCKETMTCKGVGSRRLTYQRWQWSRFLLISIGEGNISVPLQKVGKLIVPTPQEIKLNNRARSAKLRIATLKK